MSWITVIWSTVSGAGLMLALMQARVWWLDRRSWANLCFAIMVLSVIEMAIAEMSMMTASSPEAFVRLLRLTHLFYGIGVVGSVGFVHFYFGTDRRWLLALTLGLRALAVVANFTTGLNLNLSAVYSLKHITFLGEQISILGEWVMNPWQRLGWIASLAHFIYVLDASIRLWRTGSRAARRRALLIGGPLAFFVIFALANAGLVVAGVLRMPYVASVPFLGVLLVMGYEMSGDVLRAAQLNRDLVESEQRLALAVDAANLGIWFREFAPSAFWASDKWRELFGFMKSDQLDFERFMQRLHPDDREPIRDALTNAIEKKGRYEKEYRVVLPDGRIRWIASRGQVEANGSDQPLRIRGASLDITARKQAEEAAQILSGRLIHAQEDERRRLARELHDDFNQSLALLSIELDLLRQKQPAANKEFSGPLQALAVQLKTLSSNVHRLSHELHPAKLEQLGLAATARSFCREFGEAHKIAVEFVIGTVPRELPDDIALCLYRIVQEGLQNVVKHSGAAAAKVELAAIENEICLVVSDQGCGFDSPSSAIGNSLGLISMHERVRLVRGHIAVESYKGEGTRITVHVPLGASNG